MFNNIQDTAYTSLGSAILAAALTAGYLWVSQEEKEVKAGGVNELLEMLNNT